MPPARPTVRRKTPSFERQPPIDQHSDFQTLAKEAEAQADWQAAAGWYSLALEQRSAELALINGVQEGLSSKMEMQAIYDLVGDSLRDTFNAQVVMISQYDPITQQIRHHYAIERGQHLHIPGWHPIDSTRLKIVRTSRPLMINQMEILSLLTAEKMQVVPGTEVPKTWLGVPILVRNEVKGIVSLQNLDKENAFTASDIDLLTALTNSLSLSLENARLFHAERRRADQFRVISEIDRRLSLTLDFEELLKQVVTVIQQAFGYYHVAIGLIEGSEVVYQYGAGVLWNQPDFHLVPSRLKVGSEGLSGWVAANGILLNVPDVSVEPRYIGIAGSAGRSELIVPIIVKERVIGTLDALSDRLNAFDEIDEMMMQSLAHQVGAAVENTRLLADMQNRLAQLAALQETSRAMVSTLDLDTLLKLIIQQATTLLHGEGGILNMVDWEKREDEVVACVGSASETLGITLSLDQSLSGWVALHNLPQISNRAAEDPRVTHLDLFPFSKKVSKAAVAPLSIKDHVIGTLVVIDKLAAEAVFTQADLELLVGFANHAAAAIENARLYAAERHRAEQFRVISEVGRQITSATAVDELLLQMAHLIQASFGYYHVGIGLIEDKEVVSMAEVGACEAAYRSIRIPLGQGSWGWVAQRGEALLQANLDRDPRFHHGHAVQEIHSHICVPMQTKDTVIGVLSAASDRFNAFDASDQMVLQSLAFQAAVAIENIRFYERAQQMAVMEERSRLARELHDAVTQTLFSASLIAEAVPSVWDKDPGQGRELLQELRGLSRGALAEMRTLLLELRPAALLETRLEDLLRQLGESASGREGIPVNFTLDGEGTLPSEIHVAIYRIAQEALNNVVKHARASQVMINLCYLQADPIELRPIHGVSVRLTIADNGRGFDLTQTPHHRLGLGIMQERAQVIGAQLLIESHPGEGTRVSLDWQPDKEGKHA